MVVADDSNQHFTLVRADKLSVLLLPVPAATFSTPLSVMRRGPLAPPEATSYSEMLSALDATTMFMFVPMPERLAVSHA